jgi:hypothetical protein
MNEPSTTKSLYDRDFSEWLFEQAALLRAGRFDQLDVPNLVEEIEDLGKSQRRALLNRLRVLLVHLLKLRYQPTKRTGSWLGTVREQRFRLRRLFKESPSLRRFAREDVESAYQEARLIASDQTGLPPDTFPAECPFAIDSVLDDPEA